MKSMRGGFFFLLFVVKFLNVSAGTFLYVIPIEDMFKDEWVESHNYYRRLVSNPEAANMRLMTWDDGLAALAEEVVRTCDFSHTPPGGLATSAFPEAGENLYSGGKHEFQYMSGKQGITKDWYDEVNFYTYEDRSCQTGEECGHYTQVVWADTYKVGCAVARCDEIDGGNPPYLVSCNYGPAGNIKDYGTPRAPYVSGNSCSQCGVNDGCNDQLCNNTARDNPLTAMTTVESTSTTLPTTTAADVTTSEITTGGAIATTRETSASERTTTSPEKATSKGAPTTAERATTEGTTRVAEIATSEDATTPAEIATDLIVATSPKGTTTSATTELDTAAYSPGDTGNSTDVLCVRGTCVTTTSMTPSTTSSGPPSTHFFHIAVTFGFFALFGLILVSAKKF